MERVDAKETVRMNPGEGETSYARNSKFQSAEQGRMKPLIEAAITELCSTTTTLLPDSVVVIADLGCSCGPNAITLLSTAVEAVRHRYGQQLQLPPPELSLLLNDLPSNDFNAAAKHLVAFRHRLRGEEGSSYPSVISAGIVPGSFHGRLFTTGSVHLFLSSNSLHWLSQAPEDLVKNGISLYNSNQQSWLKMRPVVLDAYARQFRKDFTSFLGSRAQEVTPGGRMVLSFTGVRATDHTNQPTQTWELICRVLDDMATRGALDREKLKTFYVPLYAPYEAEVRDIIEEQGSFLISSLQVHDSMIGMNKTMINPKMIAYGLSAAFGPIIRDHFGSSKYIMDEFVQTVERHMTPDNLHEELANNPRVFIAMFLATKV